VQASVLDWPGVQLVDEAWQMEGVSHVQEFPQVLVCEPHAPPEVVHEVVRVSPTVQAGQVDVSLVVTSRQACVKSQVVVFVKVLPHVLVPHDTCVTLLSAAVHGGGSVHSPALSFHTQSTQVRVTVRWAQPFAAPQLWVSVCVCPGVH
jgi:hypothetical protein